MGVGDVNLIAKIAPKNDGFVGMVDASQVIGGVGNTLPTACETDPLSLHLVNESNDVTGGTFDLTTTGFLGVGGINDNSGTPVLSIDPNNRSLYAADGTTSMVSYSIAKNLSLNHGSLTFDEYGNLTFNTSFLLKDYATALSIDGFGRKLIASNGTTEVIDWSGSTYGGSAVISQVVTDNIKMPNMRLGALIYYSGTTFLMEDSGLSSNGTNIWLQSGVIQDSGASSTSIDPNNRILYDTTGLVSIADWSKIDNTNSIPSVYLAPIVDSSSNLAIFPAEGWLYADDGTIITFGWRESNTQTSGYASRFYQPIVDMSNNQTADLSNRIFYANDGTTAVLKYDITSGLYGGSSPTGFLNLTDSTLYSSDGTTKVFDWGNNVFYDRSGGNAVAIDIDGAVVAARSLIDGTGVNALSWENRILYASDGTTPMIDWSTVGGIKLLAGQDIRPSVDSTTAINIAQADGTDFVTFDTTNKHMKLKLDNSKLYFGAGDDASITYDGTNFVFNSAEVGSGEFKFITDGSINKGILLTNPLETGWIKMESVFSTGNAFAPAFSGKSSSTALSGLRFRGLSAGTGGRCLEFQGANATNDNVADATASLFYFRNWTDVIMEILGSGSAYLQTAAYPVFRFIRKSSGTTSYLGSATVRHQTTADMADGFGVSLNFEIQDSAAVNNIIAEVGAVRDGNDSSGALVFRTRVSGTGTERVRITSAGSVKLVADNQKLMFGAGDDASITYNGTNLLINPREAGSGNVLIQSANLSLGNSASPNTGGRLIAYSTSAAVVDVVRDTMATSAFSIFNGMNFERKMTGGTASASSGIGMYFKSPDDAGNTTFCGLLGGSLATVTDGAEVGEIVMAAAFQNTDPGSKKHFSVKARSVESGDALVWNGALKVRSADSTLGTSNGIWFKQSTNEIDTSYHKGAVLFERTGTEGRGSIHICSNDTASGVEATLADSALEITSTKNVLLQGDSRQLFFGAGDDASITYDGTNFLIDPRVVGTGSTKLLGNVVIGDATAGEDFTLTFDGETNDGVITWMEDEDYFKFSDDVMMLGGENIVLDTTTGTKIGTATSQLLGFYNATPVDQPASVADATGAGDVVAQLNSLLARMRELGLIAT